MPDMRFYCGVLCSVHTRHTFLLGGPAFGSRLSLFLCQEKRDGLREVAFLFRRGSGSPVVRSRMSCGYQTLLVHFELLRFFVATPTGLRSRRRGGSTFLRKPLGFVMFPRGVRWGLRAPKPAPKSHWLSGLSSFDSRQSAFLHNTAIIAISEQPHSRCAALGYTERPCRVQFMLGRVGLYSDDSYCIKRPDSKRPQALKSRVARAERSGCRVQPCRGPTVERSIGTKPMSKAGESGASVKSPCSGSANFGSATTLNRS